MLVLTRAIGESIRIADDVYVTVVNINGKQVRVGIEAPQTMAVHREEVFNRIAAGGAAAAAVGAAGHDGEPDGSGPDDAGERGAAAGSGADDAPPATADSGGKTVRIIHKPRRRILP